MWWHVFRRKFATVCTCLQITLAVAQLCKPFVTLGSGAQHRASFPLATYNQSKKKCLSGLAPSHLPFQNPVRGAERPVPPLIGRWWNILLALVNPAILVQTQLRKRQASSLKPGKTSPLKGVLFHASWHFLQCPQLFSRMNNGQKSRGCKLETWASQLERR